MASRLLCELNQLLQPADGVDFHMNTLLVEEGDRKILLDAGFGAEELNIATHSDGEHKEWYWRREFPTTYQWLFQNISTLDQSLEIPALKYWPNPARDVVNIEALPGSLAEWQASIYSADGQRVMSQDLSSTQIELSGLPSGPYFILLRNAEGKWALLHLSKL